MSCISSVSKISVQQASRRLRRTRPAHRGIPLTCTSSQHIYQTSHQKSWVTSLHQLTPQISAFNLSPSALLLPCAAAKPCTPPWRTSTPRRTCQQSGPAGAQAPSCPPLRCTASTSLSSCRSHDPHPPPHPIRSPPALHDLEKFWKLSGQIPGQGTRARQLSIKAAAAAADGKEPPSPTDELLLPESKSAASLYSNPGEFECPPPASAR